MEKRVALAYRLPALLFPLLFLLPALPPFVDYPQHVAIAAVLRRLADPGSFAAHHYEANLLTYNGLFDELAALLSLVLPVERAARLVVVGALELVVVGAFRLFARQRAPALAYLLVVPLLPSFTLFWGFTNHLLGLGLGLVFVAELVETAGRADASAPRRAAVAALGLLVAHTHVLATLVCLLVAAAWLLEEAVANERSWAGVFARVRQATWIVAPLCAFCIFVHRRQFATHAHAYVVSNESETDPLASKLAWFGSRVTGALRSHADGKLVWAALALAALATAVAWARSNDRGIPGEAKRPVVGRVVVGPVVALAVAYLAVPGVFVGTHLVYPRLAFPLAALALGLVRVGAGAPVFEAAAALLAVASFFQTGRALAAFDATAQDLVAVLAEAPPDAWLAPVHEGETGAFTEAYEPPVLHHVAAYHVAAHDTHAAGLFGNYASLPVRFRSPEGPVRQNWLEANGTAFDPGDPYAARFPLRLVVLAHGDDPLPPWARADHELLARRGRFALVRTVELSAQKQSTRN
jgi:hypothetical protein